MSSDKRARRPRALAAILPRVTKSAFRARGFAEGGVLTDWPDIVGQPLADYTIPESLGPNGVLQVRVSGGWALELAHLEPLVLERIAGYYGYRAVERLALVQGPVRPPGKPARPALRPLEAHEEAALDACVADTSGAGLREALRRLGRAVIGMDGAGKAPAGRENRHGDSA